MGKLQRGRCVSGWFAHSGHSSAGEERGKVSFWSGLNAGRGHFCHFGELRRGRVVGVQLWKATQNVTKKSGHKSSNVSPQYIFHEFSNYIEKAATKSKINKFLFIL
jgi:hypothetical protein